MLSGNSQLMRSGYVSPSSIRSRLALALSPSLHGLKTLSHGILSPRHSRSASSQQWLVRSQDEQKVEIKTVVGTLEMVNEAQAEVDHFGEPTAGNLHLVGPPPPGEAVASLLGLKRKEEVFDLSFQELKRAQQDLLSEMGLPRSTYPGGQPTRAIFCSRTLSLRNIRAIGYDMDYTLIQYDVNAWEQRAYEYGLQFLRAAGVPVEGLQFDPTLVIRGLIVDKERGNLLKVDRFGYVKRAMHGTEIIKVEDLRSKYGREVVSLRNEARFEFLNTLFSVSEAVLYMQMVDRLDNGRIPSDLVPERNYLGLWKLVNRALYQAHVEGQLKAEIIKNPHGYVELEAEMAQTLLDQRAAGKQLVLITNSDLYYTDAMMSFAYNGFMPEGETWRDLFEIVIVQARKPDFFNNDMSMYEVVTPDGLMRPCYAAKKGGLYCGGTARMVEKALGIAGDDILYVGDHIYTDAALAKINLRWRTCLIVRELEEEIQALTDGRPHRQQLKELFNKKELIGDLFNLLRLTRKHILKPRIKVRTPASNGNGAGGDGTHVGPMGGLPKHKDLSPVAAAVELEEVDNTMGDLSMLMGTLDEKIGPMLAQDGSQFNERWGYLSRAGFNDKSQFTRQIEKYADIYTSRVSNFLRYTPFMYFRSPSQPLAHDRPSARAEAAAQHMDLTGTWEAAATWEDDFPEPVGRPAPGRHGGILSEIPYASYDQGD